MPVQVGSSPLARGTFDNHSTNVEQERLIPARAGNIPPHNHKHTSTAAHPRSRGEHVEPAILCPAYFGSSPLARGTSTVRRDVNLNQRLIPARAGNMLSPSTAKALWTAHPRSRGEHPLPRSPRQGSPGSSPLARGTSSARPAAHTYPRLIPARAGNI